MFLAQAQNMGIEHKINVIHNYLLLTLIFVFPENQGSSDKMLLTLITLNRVLFFPRLRAASLPFLGLPLLLPCLDIRSRKEDQYYDLHVHMLVSRILLYRGMH